MAWGCEGCRGWLLPQYQPWGGGIYDPFPRFQVELLQRFAVNPQPKKGTFLVSISSFVLASPARLDLTRRLDVGMCDGVYRLIGSVLEGVGHSLLLAFHPGLDELDVQTPVRSVTMPEESEESESRDSLFRKPQN